MKIKSPEGAGTKTLTKSVSALQRNIQLAAMAAVPTATGSASRAQGQSCSNRKWWGLDTTKKHWEKQWPTCLPVVSGEGLHLAYEVRSRWRCAKRGGGKGMVLLIPELAQEETEMWPWSREDTEFKMVESKMYSFHRTAKTRKLKMCKIICVICNSISVLYTGN